MKKTFLIIADFQFSDTDITVPLLAFEHESDANDWASDHNRIVKHIQNGESDVQHLNSILRGTDVDKARDLASYMNDLEYGNRLTSDSFYLNFYVQSIKLN